jgi:hypothetical protein
MSDDNTNKGESERLYQEALDELHGKRLMEQEQDRFKQGWNERRARRGLPPLDPPVPGPAYLEALTIMFGEVATDEARARHWYRKLVGNDAPVDTITPTEEERLRALYARLESMDQIKINSEVTRAKIATEEHSRRHCWGLDDVFLEEALAEHCGFNRDKMLDMTMGEIANALRDAYYRQHPEASRADPSSIPIPPALSQINSIRRKGLTWEIQFGEESGSLPVKDFSAMMPLANLLSLAPYVPVPLANLVDEETRRALLAVPQSSDEVLDSDGIAILKHERQEVLSDMEKYEDDPIVLKETQDKLDSITAELKKYVSQGGRRKRRLGKTPGERAWDSSTKNLRRLWPRLHDARMPKLGEHLEQYIIIDFPNLTYQPPSSTVLWTVDA